MDSSGRRRAGQQNLRHFSENLGLGGKPKLHLRLPAAAAVTFLSLGRAA